MQVHGDGCTSVMINKASKEANYYGWLFETWTKPQNKWMK
jgi:hypothetical protein